MTSLTPVEQTALLTVYARALDNRKPRSILRDTWADAAVAAIDYDFAALGVQTSVVCQTALRAKMLDARVSAFTAAHPDAAVVDLGGGLDSGFYRVAPPPTVDWYTVDLAAISALRDQMLPANPTLIRWWRRLPKRTGPQRFLRTVPPCWWQMACSHS